MTATQNVSGSARFDSWILRVARWFLFATLLVPLVVFPGFFFPFVTIRAVYFRVVVELAVALLLYLFLRREIVTALRRDFVLWALLAWVTANALAAVFGVAVMRSLFGDHERMGGVWFWIHLLAYYVALRTALRPDDWWRFFRVSVAVAVTVAGYGLVQYWFRPFAFGLGGVDAGSTIGNGGLLAIYLVANVAFCGLLAVRARPAARLGYTALALLLGTAMVFTGNRSSTLALLLGSGTALVSFAFLSGSFRGRRALIAGVVLASAGALPFATRMPLARPLISQIPALKRLSSGVDSSRVLQWRAAIEGIRERPLLGVGPENYQIVWSRYYHRELYRFSADQRWDRAHNAYLDAFATAGVFGLLSLLSIWIALAWSAKKAAGVAKIANAAPAKVVRPGAAEAIALGFFLAYAFYLFFWFFDINSAMLWIALAAFVASRASDATPLEIGARRERRWQSTMVLGFGAVGLISVLYVHGFGTLRMARTLVYAGSPGRPVHQTLADFESVFASPAPVTQHAFVMYAGHLRALYPSFPELRRDPIRAEVFNRAFILAIKEFERQEVQDPLNESVLVQHARVLILGAYYYGTPRLYESALTKLHQAVALSPRRVNTRLVLGTAYLNAQRPDKALQVFLQAYAVDPLLAQTHSYLADAYADLGEYDSAGHWLRSALAYGYTPDQPLVRAVVNQFAATGKPRAGAELALDYLIERAGTPFLWSAGAAQPDFGNAQLAAIAADLFSAAGDSLKGNVIRAAAPGLCDRPLPLLSLWAVQSPGERLQRAPDCKEPWRVEGIQ